MAATAGLVWRNGLTLGPAPSGSWLAWWGIALAFYVAEAWPIHVHFRKQAHTLSMTEIGLIFGLFFATPGALFAGQIAGAGLALAFNRRQRPVKFAFNIAEQSLCTGVALLIFRALAAGAGGGRLWVAALVAVAIAHLVGVVLVSAVIAVAERTPLVLMQLPKTVGLSLVGSLAVSCLALVGVALVESRPVGLLLLAFPVGMCLLAFRGYMQQRMQRDYVEFLYESMRAAQGAPEMGLAIGQLLLAAQRLLRADYAEIILLTRTADEPVLRSTSGSAGQTLMRPDELSEETNDAILLVSAAERAVLLPRKRERHILDTFLSARGLEDGVLGVLRGDEGVFGLLLVGGRIGDVTEFDENDLVLFETFNSHAAVLLQNGRLEQSLAQVTELQEQLRHQAYHDALTGLPNRALFTARVTEAVESAAIDNASRAVLFLDLDDFKFVNDSWGHAAGDEMLVQVAERLRSATRPGDTPARLAGDEFGVLLANTSAEDAEHVAQRIRDALAEPFWLSGRETSLYASIGVALTGPHAATAEELLLNADIAMYVAKSDERSHYAIYEPRFHQRLRERQELAVELRRALERDEIVVHYQPVISLETGEIEAFEALARWEHPERGLLVPDEFLGIAEESGLIVELGASIMAQALSQVRNWQETLPGAEAIGLWVNLAPGEFTNDSLVEDLSFALSRARFDPRKLTVEITEHSVMRDEHNGLKAMHRLRDLGVALSIDDFGTGYSSLSRLAQFPIQLLKIPKTFVDPLAGDEADTSFIDAILRLAEALGIVTVAEGIEHAAQARRLREVGCELAQGYVFSEPLTADETQKLLAAQSTFPVPAHESSALRLAASA
ncbi:MAG TPA: EAL domain-containing protein [Gaiellaceae bacterium]|jgi:diguanylate cyclase (GGDEF)-like protein